MAKPLVNTNLFRVFRYPWQGIGIPVDSRSQRLANGSSGDGIIQ